MPRPRKVPLPTPEGMISTKETCAKLGLSRATLIRYRKDFADFPAAQTFMGAQYYDATEVDAWKRKHMGE